MNLGSNRSVPIGSPKDAARSVPRSTYDVVALRSSDWPLNVRGVSVLKDGEPEENVPSWPFGDESFSEAMSSCSPGYTHDLAITALNGISAKYIGVTSRSSASDFTIVGKPLAS